MVVIVTYTCGGKTAISYIHADRLTFSDGHLSVWRNDREVDVVPIAQVEGVLS